MQKSPKATSKRTTVRSSTFIDLYLADSGKEKKTPLKLIARYRGHRSARRSLERPDFLVDLVRSGQGIYMSSICGKTPNIANELPGKNDEDMRCWWKAYPRFRDGQPLILWSLVWPKSDEILDDLLDLIGNSCGLHFFTPAESRSLRRSPTMAKSPMTSTPSGAAHSTTPQPVLGGSRRTCSP